MRTRSLLPALLPIVMAACSYSPPDEAGSGHNDDVTSPGDGFSGGKADSQHEAGLVTVVRPLIKTNWGQDGAYQSMTPLKDGKGTYPGCTTIASAQILYYYQHQNHANQPVSYVLEHAPLRGPDVSDDGSTLSIDLPAYSYDFNAMPATLKGATDAEIDATALFIYHVAASMNAQFGGGEGSSASGRQLENAFRYQWGFNSISRRNMSIIGKDAFNYNNDEWAGVIRQELAAGRPVLYMALQEDASAGHAFIIDGYATNGLVHVNWGWGGRANGWFDVNTLEDPYGRRWTRDAMIFRGLEPTQGRGAELAAKQQGDGTTSPNEHTWNGAFSLISYASGTTTGYGLTQDETVIHPGNAHSPVVFLQWEIDARDGARLALAADGMDRASITYGPWSNRKKDRLYRNVQLPFVLDPTRDGLSAADGEFYVIAIAFEDSPSARVTVHGAPTKDAASAASSVAAPPVLVDGRAWNGNGSVISAASGIATGYGLTLDETQIHPSLDHAPVVFFQWELDAGDGSRLQLEAGDVTAATVRYGLWSDRSRDVSRTVSLPYTIDPAADGFSAADGEYYVVMLAFDQSPAKSTSVVATAIH